MIPIRIHGATRVLGQPYGWNEERDGRCSPLAVRDEITSAGPTISSAWELTPAEVERVKAGAPIILSIIGNLHPPVAMRVGTINPGKERS